MKRRMNLTGLIVLIMVFLLLSACGDAPRQKVFVLGVDGLTFDLLVPWVQEGKLPNFAKLMAEGSSTQLISTIPPSSPPAWTTATTGVNPGKHSIYGFQKSIKFAEAQQMDKAFFTARDRKADPLWVILSERGRRSLVINVPCSSPPDKLRGIMISGVPHTSRTHFTYPPEYRFKIPAYPREAFGRKVTVGEEETYLADLDERMDRRAKLVFDMLEEEPWDLFFVVFTITDRVQHFFWKYMDPEHPAYTPEKAQLYGEAILNAYRRVDDLLGRLRAELDSETTLIIMSDHGFGPVYKLVNGLKIIEQLTPGDDLKAMPAEGLGALFSMTTQRESDSNRKIPGDQLQPQKKLRSILEELKDPASGQRVVQKVFNREDLFRGPYLSLAPDILGLESRGYLFWNSHPPEDTSLFIQSGHESFHQDVHFFSGYHMLNGVFIAAGDIIRAGINNFDARMVDIAPTVLYLLGEPVPEEMDGKILSTPLSGEYVTAHPLDARWTRDSTPRRADGLADSSEAINKYIEEQLRAIGYVQ